MATAEKVLQKLGYVPSNFNQREFMATVERFFKRPDDILKIRGCYLGDFRGQLRELGFISDVNMLYRGKMEKIYDANFHLYTTMPSYDKGEAVRKLSEEFGEEAVCAAMRLYDPQTYKLLFHIAIDCQYVENAMFLFDINKYKVSKRTEKGIKTWRVSLL